MNISKFLRYTFIFAITLSFSSNVYAQVYKYIDKEGSSHYVDDPSKVPEEYRDASNTPHELPNIVRDGNIPQAVQNKEPPVPTSVPEAFNAEEELNKMIAPPSDSNTLPSNQKEISSNKAASAAPALTPQQERIVNLITKFLTPRVLIFLGIVVLLYIACLWILLERADMPGYGIIIPLYNAVLISRLGGFSGWWSLWIFVPFIGAPLWGFSVNFFIAKNFGKSDLFAFGTALFPFIFLPIIAFGNDTSR